MDPDPPSSAPRKVKFAPKAVPRRKSKLVIPKKAEDDEFDQGTQQSLLRKAKELQTSKRPKAEKESSVPVAFLHGGASTATKTIISQRESSDDQNERINSASDGLYSKASPLNDMQKLATSLSNAGTDVEVAQDLGDLSYALTLKKKKKKKKKKEYQEPWDYESSNYPITLPLRKPYSGDPELLDKAEFEGAVEYDENSISSASDLGLLEQDETRQMLLFKFPSKLPLGKQATSGSIKGKEIAESSINAASGHPSTKHCSLEELPRGYMGKMLVYKSGAVKLKVGEILYDVSPGSDCSFPQCVMAINTSERHCCELGGPKKRAIVTPDIDSLLENGID